MTPNPGHLPPEAAGRRVVVQLASGEIRGRTPVNADSKLGWAANTTRWTRTGSHVDVVAYEVLR